MGILIRHGPICFLQRDNVWSLIALMHWGEQLKFALRTTIFVVRKSEMVDCRL
jgi:hypothetical protein